MLRQLFPNKQFRVLEYTKFKTKNSSMDSIKNNAQIYRVINYLKICD